MAVTLEARQIRAWEMLSSGTEVRRINENEYQVASQNGNGFYLVTKNGESWSRGCKDSQHHGERTGMACKHIYLTFLSLNFREQVTAQNLNLDAPTVTVSAEIEKCARCGTQIQKWGWR